MYRTPPRDHDLSDLFAFEEGERVNVRYGKRTARCVVGTVVSTTSAGVVIEGRGVTDGKDSTLRRFTVPYYRIERVIRYAPAPVVEDEPTKSGIPL